MLKEKEKKIIFTLAMIIGLIIICLYVVRFNTINNNSIDSLSSSQLVLDKDKVTEINIEIDESIWQELLDNATSEEYYSANITINDETFYNVGLRTKGNSSLSNVARDENSDRYSLKIKFDKYVDGQTYYGIEKLALNNNYQDPTYMKEYLSYEIFSSLGVPTPEYSYASISINGEPWGLYLAIEDIDERYIEKYYGSVDGNLYKPETMDLNNDNMGQNGQGNDIMKPELQMNGENSVNNNVDSNSAEPNNLQEGINGNIPSMPENMPEGMEGNIPPQMPNDMPKDGLNETIENGIQGNRQKMMGGFNKGNNGGADLKYIDDNIESYSTITESAEFKTTTEADYQKIIDMIKNLNNGENLEEYLNVEEILKYFAVNTFLVNLDSYSGGMYHNYYLYERDGVFEMLPWDLNMSFAGFGVNNASSAVNFPIDSPVTGSLEDAPLIGKLLEFEEYKELYHSYLNQIVENFINNDGFNNLVTKVNDIIKDYVKEDVTAFYTYDEYESAVSELRTFMQDRSSSIIAQLNGEQPSTEYGTIETAVDLSILGGQGQIGMDGNKGDKFDINNIPGEMNGGNNQMVPPNMNGADMEPPNMNNGDMTQPPDMNIPTNQKSNNIENGNI